MPVWATVDYELVYAVRFGILLVVNHLQIGAPTFRASLEMPEGNMLNGSQRLGLYEKNVV